MCLKLLLKLYYIFFTFYNDSKKLVNLKEIVYNAFFDIFFI